jgi:hypothetical protein
MLPACKPKLSNLGNAESHQRTDPSNVGKAESQPSCEPSDLYSGGNPPQCVLFHPSSDNYLPYRPWLNCLGGHVLDSRSSTYLFPPSACLPSIASLPGFKFTGSVSGRFDTPSDAQHPQPICAADSRGSGRGSSPPRKGCRQARSILLSAPFPATRYIQSRRRGRKAGPLPAR